MTLYALETEVKLTDGKTRKLYAKPGLYNNPISIFGTDDLNEATLFRSRKIAEQAIRKAAHGAENGAGWQIVEVEQVVSYVRK